MSKVIVWSDGGCRNNPGPAAWAYVVQFPDGRKVSQGGFLEHASNNLSEYRAIYEAVSFLASIREDLMRARVEAVEFRSDSMLCVQQLNGYWSVKEPSLQIIFNQTLQMIGKLGIFSTLVHIPRAQNTEADQICNDIQNEHGVVGKPNPKKVRA